MSYFFDVADGGIVEDVEKVDVARGHGMHGETLMADITARCIKEKRWMEMDTGEEAVTH